MDVFDSRTPKGLDASMHALIINAGQDDNDNAFLKVLATVTELNSEVAAASGHSPNLHFTLPPPDVTALAWQAILTPKFFIRFYDYDGRDSPNKHPGLVSRLQKSLEIIAAHAGTSEPTLKISPPSAPALPNVTPPSTFLVYGALQLLCNTVLSQQVWSVPQVTFETYPFESYVIPSIFLCLAGYICPDENTVINSVKTAWLQSPAKEQMVDIILSSDKSFSGVGAYLRAQNAILNMAPPAGFSPALSATPLTTPVVSAPSRTPQVGMAHYILLNASASPPRENMVEEEEEAEVGQTDSPNN
ncbi:hypothetical protein SCLCIDRAFT_29553 [Scleroderma citrinum Foug A]|uniref:Uncharacterized protein n=1 Tax=Scleroderma citrinum Foug A TaxID=1036808 RepID=A0A0C3DKB5_9AGAM|nr:hypothetical protein SCLCIDRAFT_29553 [Scleroderma citrinum Foug A]